MKGPTLYRFSVERRYDRIPDYAKNNPSDVYWTDQHGSTALHILCQARDVDRRLLIAAEAVAKEAPSLIAKQNHATWTPLHYAAEKRLVWGGGENHGATELVLMLLKYCPEAVSMRTQTGFKSGKTPFHIACEANADIRVLRAMLRINPGLSTEPYVRKDVYSVAENPLQLIWNNNNNDASTSARQSMTVTTASNTATTTTTSDKMALLLRAAHYGTVEDDFHSNGSTRRVRLLNAACSVRCPQDYFIELINQYPDQVRDLDERKLLPLHYALQNASVEAQTYSKFVLELLLDLYPDASAQLDEDGRLPLHVALMDSQLTWHKGGIRELVYSYPRALRTRDPLHNLYPFMASAYHAIKSMLHLSTTYELLLAAPDVIEPHFTR